MSIVQPLILDATATVAEVRPIVANAKSLRWVVIRAARGFDIIWYLFRLDSVERRLEDAPAERSIGAVMDTATNHALDVVQLSALTSDDFMRVGVKAVLDGTRLFGVIEPLLMSAPSRDTRSITHAKSPDRDAPPVSTDAVSRGADIDAVQPTRDANSLAPFSLDAEAFVDAPSHVRASESFVLTVGLAERPTPGVTGSRVHVEIEAGAIAADLDIEILAPDFTCDSGWRQTLTVTREAPFEPRLNWALRAPALRDGESTHVHTISVLYSHRGAHCGMAARRLLVHDSAVLRPPPAPPLEGATVSVDASARPIDLTVRIAWRDDNEATSLLDWTFVSPHAIALPTSPVSRAIGLGAAAFARRLLKDVTADDATNGIDLVMEGIGGEIADAVPAGVWPVLKAVADAVRTARGAEAVPTVLLLTQETQVPWELAVMPTPLDAHRPPFLLAQCIVSRWVLDSASTQPVPPSELEVDDMAVIVGEYAPGGNYAALPNAQLEGAALTSRHGAQQLSATRDSVIGVLKGELPLLPGERTGVEAIHFACHGETERADAAASSIILNDGSTISPSMFRSAPVARLRHPFIFLNACQVGASAPSLGQYGGFAGLCVRAGCSGVIAPLWSVNDAVARDLALSFYDAVFAKATPGQSGTSVGAAFHALRQQPLAPISVTVRQPNGTDVVEQRLSATPLAYVVYGHPGLMLTRA